MRAAGVADHFGTVHSMRNIGDFLDIFWVAYLAETWPAAAGVEFVFRVEEGGAAI